MAAPSPSAMPSRPRRNGRGREPVVARSASKPAATKTDMASNPPASAISHRPSSNQRSARPMASVEEAQAPSTSTRGANSIPRARCRGFERSKVGSPSCELGRDRLPWASAARKRSVVLIAPLEVPMARPIRWLRQAGRARRAVARQASRAKASRSAAGSSCRPGNRRTRADHRSEQTRASELGIGFVPRRGRPRRPRPPRKRRRPLRARRSRPLRAPSAAHRDKTMAAHRSGAMPNTSASFARPGGDRRRCDHQRNPSQPLVVARAARHLDRWRLGPSAFRRALAASLRRAERARRGREWSGAGRLAGP